MYFPNLIFSIERYKKCYPTFSSYNNVYYSFLFRWKSVIFLYTRQIFKFDLPENEALSEEILFDLMISATLSNICNIFGSVHRNNKRKIYETLFFHISARLLTFARELGRRFVSQFGICVAFIALRCFRHGMPARPANPYKSSRWTAVPLARWIKSPPLFIR